MRSHYAFGLLVVSVLVIPQVPGQQPKQSPYLEAIRMEAAHVSTDKDITYDYDIVYVRAPRFGDDKGSKWAEIAHPALMDPGADLMLLHPDGKEELLVAGGDDGAIADPVVSFDGESVYYTHVRGLKGTGQHGPPPRGGADIHRIHVKSRKVIKLTTQQFTPNTGAADWSKDFVTAEQGKTSLGYGVLNMGPCPLPGGRVMFTSTRNAFRPPKGYPYFVPQLFVMDDDGGNVEHVGHLNIAGVLHPSVLKDGRVLFSTLESQGLRSDILWGVWSIHPDGTNWGPFMSALLPGGGAPDAFHFQTQLSDGSVIVERYYNQNNWGFGGYYKVPPQPAEDYAAFGPAHASDPRNPPLRAGRFDNGNAKWQRIPFSPHGIESFTRFANFGEGLADRSIRSQKDAPAVGKFTHPSGAPDNHLLTVYSPGPVNHQNGLQRPAVDGGIYLVKSGKAIDAPADMRLIKNDPQYNEQWPRALVSYKRIYGIAEPRQLPRVANDGSLSPHLPEGTPYGLVGTSSLYKRESYPQGVVPSGSVTAGYSGGDRSGYRGLGHFNSSENHTFNNWVNQGGDAGVYGNEDIHAIRILAMEPTTDRHNGPRPGRLFHNAANERLRILGEIPVRKFAQAPKGGPDQPLDPDGNPDTSFLAKIPADTPFTFQTLDKDGMVLNMAQTWHQLRPGEVRNDCGGCHAHSQKPTVFKDTLAARPEYRIFDLTQKTPLLTNKTGDESKSKWDSKDETGLRYAAGVKNVEYHRDVKPILQKSCVACHTARSGREPAGNLDLDADQDTVKDERWGNLPGTYARLAKDPKARFGHKPISDRYVGQVWRGHQVSRYVRMFESRRSLLTWKVHGRRTDGWTNDDFPTELKPGDATTLHWKGKPVENSPAHRDIADLDYTGSAMPPPEAVAGTYTGPDGTKIKVEPLTDEDRRTLVRWVDLGCPIDLDYDAKTQAARGFGWMLDETRPTLTLTHPHPGANKELTRLLVGMHDYYTGLDMSSFEVIADFDVDSLAAGQNLAPKFRSRSPGVWELPLTKPIVNLPKGKLTVSVKDQQGSITRIERTFSVSGLPAKP